MEIQGKTMVAVISCQKTVQFANAVLPVHAQDITDGAVMSFKSNCIMPRYVDRQYDPMWGQSGNKRGEVINLRIPPVYALRRGDEISIQDSEEDYFPVRMGEPVGVDMQFSSGELLLTVDDFVNRYVKKATLPISTSVDTDICALYKKVPNFSGTPGTIPTDIETYLEGGTVLAEAGAPVEGDEWTMVIDYRSNQKIIKALAGQFNPTGLISRQWEDARMTTAVGYRWDNTQNIEIHTVGALGGTPLTKGAGQTGASITCDGGSNSVTNYLREGDIVSFAGAKRVKANTVEMATGTGRSVGQLMTFAVTANVDTDGSGNFTIPIDPPIVITGAKQNCTAAPGDNAAVTIFGHASSYAGLETRQNLLFNRGAFVLAMIDEPIPGGMDMSARTVDEDNKISMRFLRGFSIEKNKYISRLDCRYVVAAPRPGFACRIVG